MIMELFCELEKPAMERFFIKLIHQKPKFLWSDNNKKRGYRLQIFLDIQEVYEKLGNLISVEFLHDKTIIKYVEMLRRDLEPLADYDSFVYINYLHYTRDIINEIIEHSIYLEEYETTHNFTRLLKLYLESFK